MPRTFYPSRNTSPATAVAAFLALSVTIGIAWDAPPPTGAALRYRVYRAENAAGPWSLLKTVATTATRVEVPLPGARCYRVAAVDELGQASPKSEAWCVTIATEVVP